MLKHARSGLDRKKIHLAPPAIGWSDRNARKMNGGDIHGATGPGQGVCRVDYACALRTLLDFDPALAWGVIRPP